MVKNVVRQRFLGLVCLLAVCTLGCGGDYSYSPLDDEALRRARAQGKDPAQARFDYLPRTIDNYFKGMDGIVMPPPGFAYQLLSDTSAAPPALALTDPVDTQSEIFGRNTWVIWPGGNEGFWDWLSTTYGFIDLLKLVETPREQRFIVGGTPESAGLINEPGMTRRGPAEFGLLLDVPTDPDIAAWRRDYVRRAFRLDGNCSAAADNAKPSGDGYGKAGAYGGGTYSYGSAAVGYDTGYGAGWADKSVVAKIPPPQIYGISSGVVGLRLFPNPNFDEEACRKWNARAYHEDPIGDPNMIRPYRVGMACGFCHVSWHPLNPPADMLNPKWENISGNIGAQYLRPRAAFGNLLQKDNLIYHVLDSQPPGTIDTSLVASDNINNPNTMNAVFNLPERAVVAFRNAREKQGGASAAWPSLWRDAQNTRPDGGRYAAPDPNDPETDPAKKIVQPFPDAVPQSVFNLFNGAGLAAELQGAQAGEINRRTPRVLLDGADSIGAWGALARVYLNIGTNWEQWNSLHAPVVGFRNQKPFSIANAERHSVYFLANELRVPALRDYFLKVTPPMPLLATPGGGDRARAVASASATERRRSVDLSQLERGRRVFAHNCITCHSSIQPGPGELGKDEKGNDISRWDDLANPPDGEFWDHDPGRWLDHPAYRTWAENAVNQPAFWRNNYLSTDFRVPVNLVGTNSCRAMATNAMNGHMWEDYSSDSYRSMPSVGSIAFFNPFKPGGAGMDTYRPAHTVVGAPPGGGGPGFYRVPTLVSIWATAPFIHNNALGLFNNDPSVNGRLDAFDDAIRKLLWKEKRYESSSYNDATPARLKADQGLIWRTPVETYIVMPGAYVARALGSWVPAVKAFADYYPSWLRAGALWLVPVILLLIATIILVRTDRLRWRGLRLVGYALIPIALLVGTANYFLGNGFGGLRIGPIPKGTPVNLLVNANPEAGTWELLKVGWRARSTLTEIASTRPDPKKTEALLSERVAPELVRVSKCPDFVMDGGHYFPWFDRMTDEDKNALIELLKTF